MSLSVWNFTTTVENFAIACQGACRFLLDFTVGSILLAIAQANATVVLWLEGLILTVLKTTRASTSDGISFNTNATDSSGNSLSDLDGWMWDFGFTRLPAIAATGQVTFSRFSTGQQAVVPVGAVVQTADGTQTYLVTLDTGNVAYNAGLNGYVIASNTSSVSVTIQAVNAGVQGNAVSGAINTLGQAITYVDTVTNASPFSNGVNQESDVAVKARFVVWINSLSKATYNAIAYAIASMEIVTSYTITQNYNYAGVWAPGSFYIVADDGSGSPSGGFLTSIYNTLFLAVRGMTIQYSVVAPVVTTVNVAMTITTASGQDHTATVNIVYAALLTFINGLGVGISLPYSRLAQVAYDAVGPGVITNITGITLNGGTSDVTADNQHIIRAGTVNVT